jgi:hypothetical protein
VHVQDISSGGHGADAGSLSRPRKAPAAMSKLCMITVPGLLVSSDWRLVHDRLLDEFSEVSDVLATTIEETILVIHEPATPENADRWLETVSETILNRRHSRSTPSRLTESRRGHRARHRRRSSASVHRVGAPK